MSTGGPPDPSSAVQERRHSCIRGPGPDPVNCVACAAGLPFRLAGNIVVSFEDAVKNMQTVFRTGPAIGQGGPVKHHVGPVQDMWFTPGPKPTGRKDDTGKRRYDLIPPEALADVAAVLTEGAKIYAPDNWRLVPDARARYTAALMRHVEDFRRGEWVDPKSGLPHLAHAICNAMFLIVLARPGQED